MLQYLYGNGLSNNISNALWLHEIITHFLENCQCRDRFTRTINKDAVISAITFVASHVFSACRHEGRRAQVVVAHHARHGDAAAGGRTPQTHAEGWVRGPRPAQKLQPHGILVHGAGHALPQCHAFARRDCVHHGKVLNREGIINDRNNKAVKIFNQAENLFVRFKVVKTLTIYI